MNTRNIIGAFGIGLLTLSPVACEGKLPGNTAETPAAKDKSFIAMDGLYLLGFGPRTAAAAHDLASSLYPSLAANDDMGKPSVLSVNCRQ